MGDGESWKDFWERMARDKVWAEGPFIQGTAWFLQKDILIISDLATPEMPFTAAISGNREGKENRCPGAPLLLGYHTGLHYQSLLPQGEEIFRPLSFNPCSPEDLTKTLKEVMDALEEEAKEMEQARRKKTSEKDGTKQRQRPQLTDSED